METTVGERVRLVRTAKLNIKQNELGRLLGVSGMAVSKWERNENNVAEVHLDKLARVAGVSFEWLMHGTVPEKYAPLLNLLVMNDYEGDILEFIICGLAMWTKRTKGERI